jgi:hypothetical protein
MNRRVGERRNAVRNPPFTPPASKQKIPALKKPGFLHQSLNG